MWYSKIVIETYFIMLHITVSQLYFPSQELCACGSFLVPISVDCLAPITLPAFMDVCVSTFLVLFLFNFQMMTYATEPLLYSWSNLLVQFHTTADRIVQKQN